MSEWNAGKRMSLRVTCWLGTLETESEGCMSAWNAGWGLSLRVTCRSWWETEYEGGMLAWNAGRRRSLRVKCRRGTQARGLSPVFCGRCCKTIRWIPCFSPCRVRTHRLKVLCKTIRCIPCFSLCCRDFQHPRRLQCRVVFQNLLNFAVKT